MPSLSTRAFAELLSLTAYQQSRVLLEQKYPKQAPQVFKIPFYSVSLSAIRSFYISGNDFSIVNKVIDDLNVSSKTQVKKDNNIRVFNSFVKSRQSKRNLVLLPSKKYSINIGNVSIRLAFDITAFEGKITSYIFYNFRNAPLDEELARLALEISYFVLRANNVQVELKNLEYIDLYKNKVYSYLKPRKTTSAKVKQNINIIEALWTTV